MNKRIVSIISTVMLGLGFLGIAGYFLFFKDSSTNAYSKIPELSKLEQIAKTDTDNDRLKDWEEALWKTDPNNQDTDNDGTMDGEETEQGRDPLIPGPDDELSEEDLQKKIDEATRQQPKSVTDALGQQILGEILINKEKGFDSFTDSKKNQITNSIVEMMDDFSENTKSVFIITDIKISQTDNKEEIKEYGNNLGLIIKKHFDPITASELTILKNALDEQSEAELQKLTQIATAYQDSSREILELEVPIEFSESHLAVINAFEQIATEVNNMQKAFVDPVISLVAVKQYQDTSRIAYKALRNISTGFLNNGIVFTKQEPGQVLAVYTP